MKDVVKTVTSIWILAIIDYAIGGPIWTAHRAYLVKHGFYKRGNGGTKEADNA